MRPFAKSLLFLCIVLSLLFLTSTIVYGQESYFYAGNKALISKSESGEMQYLFDNALSHKAMMMTERGDIIFQKNLPFGQSIANNLRFNYVGKEEDLEDIHYFGARYYSANLGRFISKDPVLQNHAYVSVRNNPLYYIDPDGLDERVLVIYSSKISFDETGAELIVNWINNKIPGKIATPFDSMDYENDEKMYTSLRTEVEQSKENPVTAAIIIAEGLSNLIQLHTKNDPNNPQGIVRVLEPEIEGELATTALGQALGTGVQQCLLIACQTGDERVEDNFAQTLSRDTQSRVTAPRANFLLDRALISFGVHPVNYDENTGLFGVKGWSHFQTGFFNRLGGRWLSSYITYYINGIGEIPYDHSTETDD